MVVFCWSVMGAVFIYAGGDVIIAKIFSVWGGRKGEVNKKKEVTVLLPFFKISIITMKKLFPTKGFHFFFNHVIELIDFRQY